MRIRRALTPLCAAVGAVAMLAVGVTPAYAATNDAPLTVPRIQEWTGGTGSAELTALSRIVVDPAVADDAAAGAVPEFGSAQTLAETAQRLQGDIAATTGLTLPVVESASSAPGDVTLTLGADAGLGAEGYELDAADRIAITAPTTDGVFYAGQTLLQVFRQESGAVFPQGTVRDWPDLEYRAEHFDVSRRFMTVPQVQDEIRRASWSKLNVVQLMFNQANAFRLYSPDYADAAPTDPAQRYSESDIQAILATAAQYHVTVVPEIQNPTKMQPIANLDGVDRTLKTQCGDGSTIDFTDPVVVAWFQDLLSEFVPWFDSPYIHLGNDEVPSTLASCAYLQAKMQPGETVDDLQTDYIGELQQIVTSLGKKSMIWVNNLKIKPSTDVLIMNFGSESVATSMRGLGYKVVDSAYKTGPYDRFYVSPSDYEGKVVPRGDIYAWTAPSSPQNAGQVLAMWGDDLFFSENDYYIEMFDGRREELAERTWNTGATTSSFASFRSLVSAIGIAPGLAPLASVPTTTDGLPIHAYDFDSTYVPTAATHYPGGWKLTIPDTVGTLHGNGWIFAPSNTVAGRTGKGLGFSAAGDQSLNLGGYRITGPWTASFWIKRTADSTNTRLLRDMDYMIKVEQAGTANRFGISTVGGADYSFDYSAPKGAWAYVTLTSDGSSTSLYANGVLQQTIAQTIPLPLGGIGGRRAFGGVLDDLKVFAQQLDATQVAELYGEYEPVDPGTPDPADIAAGKPATASSVKNGSADRVAAKAFDSDPTTRWGSEYVAPSWIQVDLGQTMSITGARLLWEAAYGRSYEIQVSDDGSTWTTAYATTTGDGGEDLISGLTASGRYVRMYGTERGTSYGFSLYDFNVYGAPLDLARGKPATASSVKNGNADRVAAKAFDGDPATRWGSEYVAPSWIQVDLGATATITGVRLSWEAAYGKSYEIQVSDDGSTWTTAYATTTGDGGVDLLTGLSASGRYVRMHGTERGTSYGFSLYDFEVYGIR